MKVHNYSYAIGRPFTSIVNIRDNGEIIFKKGHYSFHNGSVLIYYEPENKITRLDLYLNGHGYYRTIYDKKYTDRGLAIMAGKFAREIADNTLD